MEFMSKYKVAALADVAPGACIILPYVAAIKEPYARMVAIKIPRAEREAAIADGKVAVVALWSAEVFPYEFSVMLLDPQDYRQVIEILGATVQLSSDPQHVRFWSGTEASPAGALHLFGGKPHVLARAPLDKAAAGDLVSISLADGVRQGTLQRSAPWFSFWTVAVPDTKGRMETICSIDVRKPGP
jgi:hypothetical protein